MSRAKYLLKKRSWSLGQRNPWRGGKRIPTVTKWKTVAKADTLEEAWSQKLNTGLDEWAVFYRGCRRTKESWFIDEHGHNMSTVEITAEAILRRAEMHGEYPGDYDDDSAIGKAVNKRAEEEGKAFAPEVQVDGSWHSNALRFATYSEAKSYAQDLHNRWLLCTGFRATPCDDEVTHVWVDGQGLRQVDEPEGSEAMPARSVQL